MKCVLSLSVAGKYAMLTSVRLLDVVALQSCQSLYLKDILSILPLIIRTLPALLPTLEYFTHTFHNMPNKSIISLCWGQKEAVRRPKQRETVPVTKAAAPAVLECQPRECVNCNRKAFRGTIICENCNRPIREVVVVEEMLAAAVELMEKPEAVAGDQKFFCKKEAASSHDLLLAYDDRCRQHRDEKTLGSFLGSAHPERPDRVGAIMARLYETGLLKR